MLRGLLLLLVREEEDDDDDEIAADFGLCRLVLFIQRCSLSPEEDFLRPRRRKSDKQPGSLLLFTIYLCACPPSPCSPLTHPHPPPPTGDATSLMLDHLSPPAGGTCSSICLPPSCSPAHLLPFLRYGAAAPRPPARPLRPSASVNNDNCTRAKQNIRHAQKQTGAAESDGRGLPFCCHVPNEPALQKVSFATRVTWMRVFVCVCVRACALCV